MSAFFERYSKFKKSHRMFFFAAITAWFLYVGYDTVIRSAQESLEAAHLQASSLEQQIIEMQELNKSMATIQEELRRAEEEMASLRSILPDAPEIELLLSSFSSAAKLSGVRIEGFEPEEPEENENGQGASMASAPPPPAPTAADPGAESAAQPVEYDENGQPIGGASTTGAGQAPVPQAPIAYPTRIKVKISGKFSQIVSFFDRSLTFGRILHLTEIDIVTDASGILEPVGSQRTLKASVVFLAFSQQPIEIKQSKDPYGTRRRRSPSGTVPTASVQPTPSEILVKRDEKGQTD